MSDKLAGRMPQIAVVGISALFPGSTDEHGFWRDIVAGKDLIGEVPPDRWLIDDHYDPDPAAPDKTYCRRGGFLLPVDFRPLDFGIPPNAVPATDSAQLLALIVAQRALLDAGGGDLSRLDRERCAVILGVTSAQELMVQMAARLQRPIWLKALRETGIPEDEAQAACERMAASYVPWQESTFPGLLGNVVAGRIANRFDLRGTNCITDAACASSLSALSMGVDELALGKADLVLAGGVDTYNDVSMYLCFSKTPALSPSGECRPFDEAADGTLLGEGLAMVVLKRLADAERAGDRIYAVIRGIGSSSDGRALSVYAPLPEGQARALRRAYEAAGYSPDTVELVEAHGTGTKAGDVAEFAGLRQVFDESGRASRQWCALGSVKSQIGHTKAAAGAAGLFKVVMALHHKLLPPTIKVSQPNPKLEIGASPFYLNTEARPWIHDAASPRRAGLSSFGFGGSNFHVALEEYNGPGPRPERLRNLPAELVLVSAATSEALVARCQELAASGAGIEEIARRSQSEYDGRQQARLSVVASGAAELRSALEQAAAAVTRAPATAIASLRFSYEAGGEAGGVAFLFPGQGSQYLGMGADLAMSFEPARQVWDQAAALPLSPEAGLHDVVFPRPAQSDAEKAAQSARLLATEWAQPALGAASASLGALLRAMGVAADAVAGHSFGEIAALHAAGALSLADMLRVARRRGELMADAAARTEGAMTAVDASPEQLEGVVAGLSVTLANRNSPRQTVLSGPVAAITEAERRLADASLVFRRLPVATGFHSPVVAGAEAPFREFLEGTPFGAMQLPVYSNAEAAAYPGDPRAARDLLASQIARPVRFAETVEALHAHGIRTFVEAGPGAVLTGLVEQCLAGRPHRAIALDRRGQHGVVGLLHGLGRLAVAGVRVDLLPLWTASRASGTSAATGFALQINGGNYGRPYPPAGGTAALPKPNPPRAVVPSPAPAPVAAPAAAAPAPAAAYEAYDAYQRALSEGHQKYLSAMESTLAAGHKEYLRAMESSFLAFCGAVGGRPDAAAAAASAALTIDVPTITPTPMAAPAWLPPTILVAPAPSLQPVIAAEAAAPAPLDRAALLLEVVAAKTGYPKEMLGLDMALEADLGIDSIKRVEILAAMQERLTDIGRIEPAEIAALRTLRHVVERLTRGVPGASADAVASRDSSPAPEQAAPRPPDSRPGLVRRAVHAAACEPAGGSVLPRMTGRVVVTPDGLGVAEELVRLLGQRGITAEIGAVATPDASALVFLGGLREVTDGAAAIAVSHEAFEATQPAAARFAREGGVFVTVQDTGGDFGLSGTSLERAWLGALAGLAKTAAIEWPHAAVRALDIERGGRSPVALAEALLRELDQGGVAREVGLASDGRRVEPLLVEAIAPAGELPVDSSSLIVASGGARGVTAAALLALARAARPRLLVLGRSVLEDEPPELRSLDGAALRRALLERAKSEGRTPPPSELARDAARVEAAREVKATLAALEAAGSPTLYAVADVRDEASVRGALEKARAAFGPITGIVHGAGVLSDKRIADKSQEAFAHVFETKVLGLRHLLAATEQDPLRLVALFSSIAAREGNAGQCDYAMANEALNKVGAALARRRGPACVVRSFNWGPLDGGMVDASLKAHFQARGVPLIEIGDGARAFVEELRGAPERAADVELVLAAAASDAIESLTLTPRAYPWLNDHSIDGVPVVPAVLVLEWFCRAAHERTPGLELLGCDELQVLKGVPLHGYRNGGDHLVVHGHKLNDGPAAEWSMELKGRDGTRHYAGRVVFAQERNGDRGALPRPALGPSPWTAEELYRELLFHGPALRVIRSVEGVSADGIVGTLLGTREMGLGDGPWRIDIAALDGGLQLARAWGAHLTGRVSLPTRIGSLRVFSDVPAVGPLRCVLRGRTVTELRTLSDLRLEGEDGRPYAELRDLEMHFHAGPRSGA